MVKLRVGNSITERVRFTGILVPESEDLLQPWEPTADKGLTGPETSPGPVQELAGNAHSVR